MDLFLITFVATLVCCTLANPIQRKDLTYAPSYDVYLPSKGWPTVPQPSPEDNYDIFRRADVEPTIPTLTQEQVVIVALMNTVTGNAGANTALLDSVRA